MSSKTLAFIMHGQNTWYLLVMNENQLVFLQCSHTHAGRGQTLQFLNMNKASFSPSSASKLSKTRPAISSFLSPDQLLHLYLHRCSGSSNVSRLYYVVVKAPNTDPYYVFVLYRGTRTFELVPQAAQMPATLTNSNASQTDGKEVFQW